MANSLLKALTENNLAKRNLHDILQALRYFFDYYFFTLAEKTAIHEALATFIQSNPKHPEYRQLLNFETQLNQINKDNYLPLLEKVRAQLEQMPTITLHTAIELTTQDEEVISSWMKHNLTNSCLFDVYTRTELLAGCQISFQHLQADYSLLKKIETEPGEIPQIIQSYLSKKLNE